MHIYSYNVLFVLAFIFSCSCEPRGDFVGVRVRQHVRIRQTSTGANPKICRDDVGVKRLLSCHDLC